MAKSNDQAALRTRRAVLERLKQNGPADAGQLAEHCGVSPMAVRQHLYQLQHEQLVTHSLEPRPRGRPAKLWRLTPQADRLFPDAHAELTVGLLELLGETFGERAMQQLLQARSQRQIETYQQRVPQQGPLQARLKALAAIRHEEGYMAEVTEDEEGVSLLVENHCPICAAASACTGLCAAELDVFQAVLGPDVQVSRTEHILDGARRCAYRVEASG